MLGKRTLVVCALATVAAASGVALVSPAQAGICESTSFQTIWGQTNRCPAPNQNVGFSRGNGTPGTSNARVEGHLDFAVPGGDADAAYGLGFNNGGSLVCSTTGDTDPNSSTFTQTSLGQCNTAVKHKFFLVF